LTTRGARTLALREVRILPSPDRPAIERGTILVRDGRIEAVGPDVAVPSEAESIDGTGGTVVAGLWNSHVHFTEPKWRNAARAPAAVLTEQLRDLATSRGFTTVVDTGSDYRSTLPMRQRIRSGEVVGPTIYTAGSGLYPPRGIPYYVRDAIPWWVRPLVPQPRSAGAARRCVERNIARGADLVKLFTGSYVARGRVLPMPEEIARAAAEVGHAHDQLVFSHASNLEGTRIAMRAGVDVLAHPPDVPEGVDDALLQEMIARRMAMIPTLKMFRDTVGDDPGFLEPIYHIVRRFRGLGGELLFGTDVGYLRDYSIDDELRALARSGLSPTDVHRMLTTAPAERFGVLGEVGTIDLGHRADLTVLDGDPREDLLAFARVRATIGAGRVLYRRAERPARPAGT
jgi:imidazolonepropionase-like amidohydrolase